MSTATTVGEQREKVRLGLSSQLHPYIVNKTWFLSCDRILKQPIYVAGFSTSQNRVAPLLLVFASICAFPPLLIVFLVCFD
ncbi:hypothetical protein [Nostoc sp. TCL240-02]|uniref:hypothetical protein n=1 Tax=Nostoc sp. TCL240-02 TaxID=2572090 RepID=UPI00157FA4EA|nr:hypothetical protein [Nostoc sp. TCL240-02]QKQ75960.1 hypothetical protein FBB35_24065 [Nostoc sp. TCL240-02]